VKYAKDGCPRVKDKLGKELLTTFDLFDASVRDFAERPCLAHRPNVNGKYQPYTSITYKQAGELAAQVGAAYKAWGLKPGDKVGIFGANSPEWMLAMQGCNRMSLVCVPIYDTLGENAVEYIINHSGAKADCIRRQGTSPSTGGAQAGPPAAWRGILGGSAS
jgi:long-chain acyl-CoA synthetase